MDQTLEITLGKDSGFGHPVYEFAQPDAVEDVLVEFRDIVMASRPHACGLTLVLSQKSIKGCWFSLKGQIASLGCHVGHLYNHELSSGNCSSKYFC